MTLCTRTAHILRLRPLRPQVPDAGTLYDLAVVECGALADQVEKKERTSTYEPRLGPEDLAFAVHLCALRRGVPVQELAGAAAFSRLAPCARHSQPL